jgi:hypothetical protein
MLQNRKKLILAQFENARMQNSGQVEQPGFVFRLTRNACDVGMGLVIDYDFDVSLM